MPGAPLIKLYLGVNSLRLRGLHFSLILEDMKLSAMVYMRYKNMRCEIMRFEVIRYEIIHNNTLSNIISLEIQGMTIIPGNIMAWTFSKTCAIAHHKWVRQHTNKINYWRVIQCYHTIITIKFILKLLGDFWWRYLSEY